MGAVLAIADFVVFAMTVVISALRVAYSMMANGGTRDDQHGFHAFRHFVFVSQAIIHEAIPPLERTDGEAEMNSWQTRSRSAPHKQCIQQADPSA